jgi:Glycosyltransferase family 87
MSRSTFRVALWGLIGVGLAIRLGLAYWGDGVDYDLRSYEVVLDVLRRDPLELYATVNDARAARWPYPPGYFSWILVAGELPGGFRNLMQLPPILADAGIALLVQEFLRRRGAGEAARLAAVALVALGPSFMAISGYHGHIDSLAILPAVAAVLVWDSAGERRALWAGLLIGVGASIKTVPALMVLALLPTVRSPREAVTLVGAAVAVPLALLAPFLVATPSATVDAFTYRGLPGYGGISLVVQPGLAELWLKQTPVSLNGVNDWLFDHGAVLTLPALGALALFLARTRPDAADAAVLVWLVVYVFGINFLLQYLPWGLPFFLMAGHLSRVAQLQAALLVPTVLVYAQPWESDAVLWVYVPFMLALWAAFVVALVVLGRRAWNGHGGARRLEAPASAPA